jgi:hypothetical protein
LVSYQTIFWHPLCNTKCMQTALIYCLILFSMTAMAQEQSYFDRCLSKDFMDTTIPVFKRGDFFFFVVTARLIRFILGNQNPKSIGKTFQNHFLKMANTFILGGHLLEHLVTATPRFVSSFVQIFNLKLLMKTTEIAIISQLKIKTIVYSFL